MPQYNFDEIIDRRGTHSTKWDNMRNMRGNPDALPMWVADSDFACAPPIAEAIQKRAAHPIYGYSFVSPDFYAATVSWLMRRHAFEVSPEDIVFSPGIVPAICAAIRGLSEPGDKVLIQRPVYHPFTNSILDNGREVASNSLILRGGAYFVDFDDLEQRAKDPRTKLMLLCSPHNPVGKVFTREELCRIADICLANHVVLVSDEIHSDLILDGNSHFSVGAIKDEYAQNTISCFAPSKTFNIAGLKASGIAVPNKRLRGVLQTELTRAHITSPAVFAMEAYCAAYEGCDDYLEQQMQYITANVRYLDEYLKKNMPKLVLIKPQGTYLAWLDCRETGLKGDALSDFFTFKCGVAINRGDMFGTEGDGFIRMNLACPRQTLQRALDNIKAQYATL